MAASPLQLRQHNKGETGQMNTTEFSELLKTLLDEVHTRVVEQFSKAEAVRDGTLVALVPRKSPVFNSHLSMQETSSTEERPTFKSSSSIALPEQTDCFSKGWVCTPRAEGAQSPSSIPGFFLDPKEALCIGPVDATFADEVESSVGRTFTVPSQKSELAELTPRNSLRTLSTSSLSHKILMGRNVSWVISPESKTMQYWDGINILGMVFVALVCPVQVAFMEARLDAMFVLNCIVDCVFIVDMLLQFFLMYYAKTNYGNRLEHRHSRIVAHYLKSWFLVDFISILPFDLLALAIQSNDFIKAKGVKIVRIVRMLKMMRMLKASRIFKRLKMSLLVSNTYQMFDLHKFILYLILISHWLACLWAMTLALVDDDTVRWVDTFEDSELSVEEKTKDSTWKLYVAALYFTAYTMTSVGYGDVTPVNILERIVCILILFISGLVWACVIGQVTSIVGNFYAQEQEFRSLMDNLSRMMRDRELPRPVRKRLTKFFLSARQARRNEQQEQILRRMSPVLQGEVALMSNWHWVNKVSFMHHLVPEAMSSDGSSDASRAPHFVVDIALALVSAIFAQSEVFGERRVLYILRRGLALSRAIHGMKVFCAGDVWGEDFVLSKSSLRESKARLAITYVEVFQLTFDSFVQVCNRHSLNVVLRQRLRRFVARLSARRAILLEARWRRFAAAVEAMPEIDRSTSAEVLGMQFQS